MCPVHTLDKRSLTWVVSELQLRESERRDLPKWKRDELWIRSRERGLHRLYVCSKNAVEGPADDLSGLFHLTGTGKPRAGNHTEAMAVVSFATAAVMAPSSEGEAATAAATTTAATMQYSIRSWPLSSFIERSKT
jgi:hypothetical protein